MPDDDDPDAPTTALRELFLIERLTGVPVGPVPVLLVEPPAVSTAIRDAIARRSEPAVLLVIDRPKAAEPEVPIDVILPMPDLDCWSPALPAALAVYKERCWIGDPQPLAQRRAFRPTRIDVTPPIEPLVCVPLRVSDCPRCGSQPGDRCVGIDRDDEVHVERVWRCLARANGAS